MNIFEFHKYRKGAGACDTLVSAQPENALFPILVTLLGIVTLVRFSHI